MNECFYYTNSKKILTNKIQAVGHQRTEPVFFYYYDHIFDKMDWSIEPPGTLEYHYIQQAQRIRDEYDYVVLFYSGGYDSSNILETFHFNNIKLDKIVCVGAFKQDTISGVDENHNGEIYNNCFPYLVELGLGKITQICDYTDYFDNVRNFSVYGYGEQWVENNGPWFSPHTWFWRDIHKYVVPEKMKDKKVALIWGRDKPYLSKDNRGVYFQFKDVAALSYGGEIKVDNIHRINFYWDPEYPIIPVKQSHHLLQNNIIDKPNSVYNLRKPILFKSGKSATNILSLRDKFIIDKQNSDVFKFYKDGIQRIKDNIGLSEIRSIQSRPYYLNYVQQK